MNRVVFRILAVGVLLVLSPHLEAGWRVPEGLGVLLRGEREVAVYEVESVNAEKRVLFFQKVEDILPRLSQRFQLYVPREGEIDHRAPPGQEASEWLLRWARPGRRIVSFNHSEVYISGYWLQMWPIREGKTPYFKLTEWHAWFGYGFAGTTDELAKACRAILDGKEVVVPVFASIPFVRSMVLTHWRDQYEELPLMQLKASSKITQIPGHRLRDPLNRDETMWRLIVAPGSGRVEQLPGLLKQLGDPSPEVRSRAARQIGGIGPGAKAALPRLVRLLEDDNIRVRITAAGAILQLNPKHAEARAALGKAATDASPAVRRAALEWLWLLDRDVDGTIAILVERQRDADASVRALATRALLSFLNAYDLKCLTKDDLRMASKSPDRECARLAAHELAR